MNRYLVILAVLIISCCTSRFSMPAWAGTEIHLCASKDGRSFYFDQACQSWETRSKATKRVRPSMGPNFPRVSKVPSEIRGATQVRDVIIPDAIRSEIQNIPPLNGVYQVVHTWDSGGSYTTVEGDACLKDAPIRDLYPGAFELMHLARGAYPVSNLCNVDNWNSSAGRVGYRFSCTQNGQTASAAISISTTPTEIRVETKAVTAVPSDVIRGDSEVILKKVGTCN